MKDREGRKARGAIPCAGSNRRVEGDDVSGNVRGSHIRQQLAHRHHVLSSAASERNVVGPVVSADEDRNWEGGEKNNRRKHVRHVDRKV